MGTTTYAEPTGTPPSTDSLSDKIGFMYMALRNSVLISATKKQFHDDACNVEWEKDLSDDATDYGISGSTLTWLDTEHTLNGADKLLVRYQ